MDHDDNLWIPRRIAGAADVMTPFNHNSEELSTIKVQGRNHGHGPGGQNLGGLVTD